MIMSLNFWTMTRRNPLIRLRAARTPPVVAVTVPCDLSLPHHPSQGADYSLSHPSPRQSPQVTKTPERHLLDNVYHTDGSPTKRRQIRHPTRLPAFRRDHAYTPTTGWKTGRRHFCRRAWRQTYLACVC